jgi:hypothetical protein
MTTEQVLEKQVEALEKLLQLKQAVIDELEAKVQRLQNPYPYYPGVTVTPYTVPSWQCTDGGPHNYPSLWGGTSAPPCTKCGAQAWGSSGSITITNLPGYQGAGGVSGITTVGSSVPFTDTGGLVTINGSGGTAVQTTGYLQPVEPNNFCSVIPLSSATKR